MLCGSALEVVLSGLTDNRLGSPGSYEIRRCVHCGLEQTFPIPSVSELKELYETYYNFGGETVHATTRWRERFLFSFLYRVWYGSMAMARFISGAAQADFWISGAMRVADCGSTRGMASKWKGSNLMRRRCGGAQSRLRRTHLPDRRIQSCEGLRCRGAVQCIGAFSGSPENVAGCPSNTCAVWPSVDQLPEQSELVTKSIGVLRGLIGMCLFTLSTFHRRCYANCSQIQAL